MPNCVKGLLTLTLPADRQYDESKLPFRRKEPCMKA